MGRRHAWIWLGSAYLSRPTSNTRGNTNGIRWTTIHVLPVSVNITCRHPKLALFLQINPSPVANNRRSNKMFLRVSKIVFQKIDPYDEHDYCIYLDLGLPGKKKGGFYVLVQQQHIQKFLKIKK